MQQDMHRITPLSWFVPLFTLCTTNTLPAATPAWAAAIPTLTPAEKHCPWFETPWAGARGVRGAVTPQSGVPLTLPFPPRQRTTQDFSLFAFVLLVFLRLPLYNIKLQFPPE